MEITEVRTGAHGAVVRAVDPELFEHGRASERGNRSFGAVQVHVCNLEGGYRICQSVLLLMGCRTTHSIGISRSRCTCSHTQTKGRESGRGAYTRTCRPSVHGKHAECAEIRKPDLAPVR